jgi:hypothetical protein
MGGKSLIILYSYEIAKLKDHNKSIRQSRSVYNMAKTNQAKKRKTVTVQEDPSSEEEREGSPEDRRAAIHIRTAENMLNAVICSLKLSVIQSEWTTDVDLESKKTGGQAQSH